MFEEEKQKLERQIDEKNSRLKEINEEQQEINKREAIIKKYEEILKSKQRNKKRIKIDIIGTVVVAVFAIFRMFPSDIFWGIVYSIIIALFLGFKDVKEFSKDKKKLEENQTQYDEAKQNEEKDKQLKLSLSNEYEKVEQEQLPLKYKLAWLKKNEALQKIGYQLELSMPNFELQELSVLDNRNKKACEQLWEQYLEEKEDYSKIHLYNNQEIDTNQILEKKFGS